MEPGQERLRWLEESARGSGGEPNTQGKALMVDRDKGHRKTQSDVDAGMLLCWLVGQFCASNLSLKGVILGPEVH